MTEFAPEQTPRSSRRTSRRRGSRRGPTGFWRLLATVPERAVGMGAAATALLSVSMGGYLFHRAQVAYPSIWLGATRSEVQYGFGQPARRIPTADGETWEFVGDGTVEDATFNGDRVEQTGCTVRAGECPPLLGVDTSEMEDGVWNRFGVPTRQEISNGTKVLDYDDIGTTFELQRFKLTRISVRHADGSFGARVGRFMLLILP